MSNFPTLKTGAVLQYPAQKDIRFSTSILRFMDGSEQRFPDYAAPLHRWTIRLSLLDDAELHQLREFFRTQNGAAGTFTFMDPWDGTTYSNCSIEDDEMADTLLNEANGKTALIIRENRG